MDKFWLFSRGGSRHACLRWRVAALLGCEVGGEVGYQVRFDKKYSDQTKIVYLTDGIFINKLLADPTLSRVGLVVFDEFHERSLQIDLALALSKKLAFSQRPSLRLILTSATLNLTAATDYLQDCESLELKARAYPVEIEYRRPKKNRTDLETGFATSQNDFTRTLGKRADFHGWSF